MIFLLGPVHLVLRHHPVFQQLNLQEECQLEHPPILCLYKLSTFQRGRDKKIGICFS